MPNHFAEKHHNPELDFTPQTISNLIYIASAAKKLAHYDEFEECVADMLVDPVVLQMNGFFQHHGVSRYEHCRMVAYYSFLLCKKLGLDARSAARAGMVHDLFLYDWRSREAEGPDSKHAYHHPQVALANAEKRFELNDREREGIATQLVASRDDLYAFARRRKDARLATGWRHELCGKELGLLLAGKVGLTVKDGRIEVL